MITPEIIARINELARKQHQGLLTEMEKKEQLVLRRQYIDHIKGQVKAQLDTIKIHDADCNCGCH
ncbi:DUF896 domain-containing protein, partial [Propionispora sp. 2/2-37]|uniref:DUF896 domain-containing protein n=1 Tax=Propionispora sp. 2/2-37 TaxID=1677858 RepID=UPI0006BB849F